MFDVNPDNLVSKTDKLLFNIWQELRQLNRPLRPTREDTVAKEYRCKYCHEPFDNRHKMANHAGRCVKNPKNSAKEGE